MPDSTSTSFDTPKQHVCSWQKPCPRHGSLCETYCGTGVKAEGRRTFEPMVGDVYLDERDGSRFLVESFSTEHKIALGRRWHPMQIGKNPLHLRSTGWPNEASICTFQELFDWCWL
jgi:hypothetical protein